jgi:AcrR family transcriptional regulator
MTTPRRTGATNSKTRSALLDAAQQLMVEEGYASVTTRRVAAKAGLKPQLVYYYFHSMDDLFISLVRRGAEHNVQRLRQALAAPQPLRALWAINYDPAGAAFRMELTALANHRKAIRSEIAGYAEQFRRLQVETLTEILARAGIDPETFPPAVAPLLITSVSQILLLEREIGMTVGHAEALALVESLLTRFEGPA